MKKIVSILLALQLVAACIYPFNEVIETPDTPILVFNGNINIGGFASVSVSLMQGFDGSYPGNVTTVSLDEWWIEDDSGVTYRPAAPSEKVSLADAPTDRQYRAVIIADGKTYSTAFKKPTAPPVPEKLEFVADDISVSCTLSFSEGADKTGYASLSVEEIWEFHAMYYQEFDIDPVTWEYYPLADDIPSRHYWCWNSAGPGREIPIDYSNIQGHADKYEVKSFSRKDYRNSRQYYIRVRIRSLSREEFLYLKNLEEMVATGGSLFTPNPGEVSGNVICESDPSQRVLGYITVSRYNTVEGSLDDRYLLSTNYSRDNVKPLKPEEYEYYYYNGWRPIYEDFSDNSFSIVKFWGPERCVDCVLMGGTLEKPEFTE